MGFAMLNPSYCLSLANHVIASERSIARVSRLPTPVGDPLQLFGHYYGFQALLCGMKLGRSARPAADASIMPQVPGGNTKLRLI